MHHMMFETLLTDILMQSFELLLLQYLTEKYTFKIDLPMGVPNNEIGQSCLKSCHSMLPYLYHLIDVYMILSLKCSIAMY